MSHPLNLLSTLHEMATGLVVRNLNTADTALEELKERINHWLELDSQVERYRNEIATLERRVAIYQRIVERYAEKEINGG